MSAITPSADPIRKFLEEARIQIANGDLQQAAITLNKAQKSAPGDARLFMLGGQLAEKAGNVKGALNSLRRCVAIAPDWAPGMLELAMLLARQRQRVEAVEISEKLARLHPQDLYVLAGVVDIARSAGHLEMSVRHLRRGLVLVPGDLQLRQMLARDLSQLGLHDEALAVWTELTLQNPEDSRSLTGYVQAAIAAGRPERAQAQAKALLALAPQDPVYAFFDQVTRGDTPRQQPAELVIPLFDGMATIYDMHMVRALKYGLPKLAAEKITARHPDKAVNVMDLGSGTGLLGVYLGRIAGALVGVDLSHQMINQAARHNVYDRFHSVNLHDALRATPGGLYQVITALDVFSYAGDATQAIHDAYRILTPGGMFVFSIELSPESGPDLALLPAMRYVHRRSAIELACQSAGFDPISVEELVLYEENQVPVNGVLVTAVKPA